MKRFFDILGWVGVALVVVAFGVRFGPLARFITSADPGPDRIGMWLAWAGLACVLVYTASQWREIRKSFERRQTRYGAIATTSVIVVLLILVAVNYLSTRRNKRWDLTENRVNTLAEQSEKVLEGLDSPLKLILFDQNLNFDRYRERLSQYADASTNVSVEYLDADRDPVRAKQYEIQAYPTLVIDYKGQTQKVTTGIEEREITGAIIRAVTGQQRKLYFVQGHGEKDPAGSDGAGYAGVAGLLKGDNITVEPLALTQHKEVPTDASVIAIAGPTADFLDPEIEMLRRYLDNGGRLLAMLDPAIGDNDPPLPKLTGLLKEWGVEVGNDVVLDVSGRSNSPTIAVAVPPYPSHPMTERYRVATVFPLARSITPEATAPAGKTVQRLVETAPAAWAETDVKQLRAGVQPEMNADAGDKQGPVAIAVTVTTPANEAPGANGDDKEKKETPAQKPQSRVAVFGDSDFATNAYAGNVGNADFFMNTVNWLTTQENLIAIRAREPGDSRLTITSREMDWVWLFSVLGMPLLVVAVGVYTWTRRRRS